MSEFSTTAEINLVVPRRELRSAREEVEEAMADIPITADTSGVSGRRSGGRGRGGTNQSRTSTLRIERELSKLNNDEFDGVANAQLEVARKTLKSQRKSVQADEQTDETLNEILNEIRGFTPSTRRGGTTNPAREQRRRRREFRWARQRTDDTESQLEVLENIEGELTEGGLGGGGGLGGDLLALGGEGAGIAADVGSTLVEALPAGIGSLVGTALGQRLSGGGGGGGQTSVERPPWVPIQTDRPDWIPIPVDDPGDGTLPDIDIPDIPDLGFDDPPTAPVGDPPTVPIEEPPTLEIEDAPTLEVERPEWVPIQVEQPDTRGRSRQGQTRRRDRFAPFERLPIIGGGVERINERADRFLDDAPVFRQIGEASGTQGGGRNVASGGGASPVSATTGDVNVTVNADVQNAVQSAIEELRREQERQREQLRADLEQQIGDLERQITGGTGRRTGPSGSGFGR